jgi:KipI family sensor histidine kinase inhibitor
MDPQAHAIALADYPRLRWCGDRAMTIEFGDAIDPAVNRRVLVSTGQSPHCRASASWRPCPRPTRSLLVHVDPLLVDPVALGDMLLGLARSSCAVETPGRLWRVPVVYGGDFGIDLESLARRQRARRRRGGRAPRRRALPRRHDRLHAGFQLIRRGLDHRLATPRRSQPRAAVPAGSVIIGGAQTGVSSVEAPNAWHIVGRTPARMFSGRRNPPGRRWKRETKSASSRVAPESAASALARAAGAGETVLELLRP